ncbi:extracellular solute-binding protein [Paenibacillus flagellatus]|uniref:ABC transporter substrate-binding protein n=1 Tax=Paenibacillus flagellatus TaxID=2211139 RepID=A0A2V5KWF8_9BACL|nr:ABC transporter substrate-binding protein [Paenibacillus flagellatus]
MKKGLSLLLASTLTLSLALTACGGTEQAATPGKAGESPGTTAANEKIALKMVKRGYTDVHPPAKDLWMWKKYEEKTGIRVDFEEIPAAAVTERKNVILGSNDLPDAFYRIAFGTDELMKYGKQGLFIPLEKLIEQHAPNLNKLLRDNPDIKRAITMSDGHIYALPYVDFSKAFNSVRLYINKSWLDEAGLAVPKTTAEFRSALKTVRQKDPARLGWVLESRYWTFLESFLASSFGMGEGGSKAFGQSIYKDKDGQIKTTFNDPKYKELLQYMSDLYKDGSLAQQNFTTGYDYAKWSTDGANNLVGSFVWEGPGYIGKDAAKNYVGINALEGPRGDKVAGTLGPAAKGIFGFIITNKNKHPVETLKWIDYFYGEEGILFGTFGIEGETYKMVDGKPKYIDDILNYKGGVQLGAFQYVDNVYGAYYPYVEPKDELRMAARGTTVADEIKADPAELDKFAPKELWPDFVPTDEEAKQTSAMLTDINKYIEEMRVKFVTGKANLDTEWDNYVKTLDKMGAAKYLDIRRKQYERYMSVK